MAERDDLVDLLQCPVCFEDYDTEGKGNKGRVPRILPCQHTFCHLCVRLLLRGRRLSCPECRTSHSAENGVVSFPVNKYVTIVKRNIPQLTTGMDVLACPVCYEDYDTEEEGSIPRFLPCYHTLCVSCIRGLLREQTLTCPECKQEHAASNGVVSFEVNKYLRILIKRRKSHDIIETHHGGSDSSDTLMETIDTLCKNLQSSREKVLNAKEQSTEKNSACLAKLRNLKEKLVEQFDRMIKHTENETVDTQSSMDIDVAAIDESIKLLQSMRENGEKSEAENGMDTLIDIEQGITKLISGTKNYKYFEYAAENIVDQMCEPFMQKYIRVHLSGEDAPRNDKTPAPRPSTSRDENRSRNLTDVKLLKVSKLYTREEDLYTFATIGLEMDDHEIERHVTNKRDCITLAAHGVLKDWRKSQPTADVAYDKLCEALRCVNMSYYILQALG